MMARMLPLLLALALSCRSTGKDGTSGIEGDSGVGDSGVGDSGVGDSGVGDGGDTGDGGTADGGTGDGGATAWCLDFEEGTLESVGHEGSFVELEDGGLVFVAEEGDDFSALVGEEALDFGGTHALVLRSSHDGDLDSVGVATTAAFDVVAGDLSLWHLSEVDERGVAFTLQLLSPDDDAVYAEVSLPVQTGGYLPELQPEHLPIAGFPEITTEGGTPGTLTRVGVDLSAWSGARVRLRLLQHTLVEDNGFFTVIDDLCHGDGGEVDLVLPPPSLTPAPRPE